MKLVKIKKEEFDKYLITAIPEYAKDKMEAGTWNEQEAISLAKDSYKKLLPNGIDTPDNFLFSITMESELIGILWGKSIEGKLFVYDFLINKEHRGKGYEKKSLPLLEIWALEQGFKEIGLHVFAHNKSAHELYKKMGYIETDITMVRRLK